MKFHLSMLLVLILIATASAGCKSKNPGTESAQEPALAQIKPLFPEDIHLVNRIEMLRSDGERKTIDDNGTIDQWLDQVGEVWVTIDPNREDHSGSLFMVTLFEHDQRKFMLAPTAIDRTKITASEELADLMYPLWDGNAQSQ